MKTYNENKILVICDSCGIVERHEQRSYKELNERLIRSGWKVGKVKDEWTDFCCVECYEEYKERE